MAKINKELHLFMPIGDDEIQVESWDKNINEKVMALKKRCPDAVVVIFDDDYPKFLRAAVKMDYFNIDFKKSITDKQKKARSENGKNNASNLMNQK